MRKKLSIAGFLIGVGCQLAVMIYAFSQAPGLPGPVELLVVLLVVAFVGDIGAVGGFAIGFVVDLFRKKNSDVPRHDEIM